MSELTLEKLDNIMDNYTPLTEDILHIRYDAVAKIMDKTEEDALVWLYKHAKPLEYEGWWEVTVKK